VKAICGWALDEPERLYFLPVNAVSCGQPIRRARSALRIQWRRQTTAQRRREWTYVFVADEHAAFGQSICALLRVAVVPVVDKRLARRMGFAFGRCSALQTLLEYSAGGGQSPCAFGTRRAMKRSATPND
jgi:hypothetical protein